MFLEDILSTASMNLVQQDQGGNEYTTDDGQLAIHMSGFYTQAEMEMKLACLVEANELYRREIEAAQSI